MSDAHTLPTAARPFVGFAARLRDNGFAVAPDQTMSFIEAVGLLGPSSMLDIHRAARATLAPPPERHAEFDALFRLHFMGQTVAAAAPGAADDDEIMVGDDVVEEDQPPEVDEGRDSGAEATRAEALVARGFAAVDEATVLRNFRRVAPSRLPQRKSSRRAPKRRGDFLDMRRALRQAVRFDGEVIDLPRLSRTRRHRRIVLLVDVSGSMKDQTDACMRFAHALVQSGRTVEVFTIGTRLTRVTQAMRTRNRAQALERASSIVVDWDSGTRLGDALNAFLSIPRFAGFARGAAVVVLSDGLERGDHSTMTESVEKLSRLAWRVVWLTPLAGDTAFAPETSALQSVLPHLDVLGAGGSMQALCERVLAMAKEAA